MSSLYIRVKTGFYTHRKTVKLWSKIGNDAFWVVPRLWAYAAENQPDGDLSSYSSDELAMLIGCSSNASSMLQALKDSGFVEESGKIHDWEEHNGFHTAFAARAKKAAIARWSKKGSPAPLKEIKEEEEIHGNGDKHCLSNASSMFSFVSRSKPTLAEIEILMQKSDCPKDQALRFMNHYEANGWKVGKVPMKSLTAAVSNWADGYKDRLKKNNGFNGNHQQKPDYSKGF